MNAQRHALPDVLGQRRLTARNVRAFLRYLHLRIRARHVPFGLLFLDDGADILIGPAARIRLGTGVVCMRDFTGRWFGPLRIGNNVFFNRGCYVAVYDTLTIGSDCLFGPGVSIHTEHHIPGLGPVPIGRRGFMTAPVTIGTGVWVGAKATILPGVTIGDGAVIGANAVVNRDVPPMSLAAGVPARLMKYLEGHAPDAHT